MSQRDAFVLAVSALMKADSRVVLLLGDIGVFGFRHLAAEFPERVINVGICEQSMVGMAAGMAIAGKIPVVYTIAPFIVRRAYEQICIDFGYQCLRGLFVSVGASFDYSSLGYTHFCPEDVALMKAVPGSHVYCPWDEIDVEACITQAVRYESGPSYIRLAEDEGTLLMGSILGRRVVQQMGAKATVVSVGTMLGPVLRACGTRDVSVLHYSRVKPFSTFELGVLTSQSGKGSRKILLVEPYHEGGLSHDIAQKLYPAPFILRSLGVKHSVAPWYGTHLDHIRANEMTQGDIEIAVDELIALEEPACPT